MDRADTDIGQERISQGEKQTGDRFNRHEAE